MGECLSYCSFSSDYQRLVVWAANMWQMGPMLSLHDWWLPYQHPWSEPDQTRGEQEVSSLDHTILSGHVT